MLFRDKDGTWHNRKHKSMQQKVQLALVLCRHRKITSLQNQQQRLPLVTTQDHGRKLTFDNIDYRREVHDMTEEHQNEDNTV